jgi:hypothetical protein
LVPGAGASNPAHAVKGVNKIQQVQRLIEVKHKIYQRYGAREEEGWLEDKTDVNIRVQLG